MFPKWAPQHHLPVIAIILRVTYDVSCVTVREYVADAGQNVTIPCEGYNDTNEAIIWSYHGKNQKLHSADKSNGSLQLTFLDRNESGVYSCKIEGENDTVIAMINLTVRSRPPPLVNVSVHLSTILGLIYWKVRDDGGSPIIDFTAEYRSAKTFDGNEELEPWRPISPNHISPNARQVDIYHLTPNSTYWFRVWARNLMGTSTPVEVNGTTLYSDTERELARVFLTGVENFDTRIWVAAVAIVMGTLCILTVGTCLLLYRECRVPSDSDEEQDVMELVPNIILNPGFMDGQMRCEDYPNTSPATVVIRSNGKYSQANGSAEPRKV